MTRVPIKGEVGRETLDPYTVKTGPDKGQFERLGPIGPKQKKRINLNQIELTIMDKLRIIQTIEQIIYKSLKVSQKLNCVPAN